MNPPTPVPSTAPSLLLVVAPGVGENTLASLAAEDGMSGWATALGNDGERAATLLLGSDDASDLLLDLGVAVDRSSITLRSDTTCDDSAIAALSRRATGPAHATVLELRSVLEAGLAGGTSAAGAAADQLAERIRRAAANVRGGQPTEVWILGLGDLEPVTTMFDFERAWQRSRGGPLTRELEFSYGIGRVAIRAHNQRAHDLARVVLAKSPFAAHGELTSSAASTLGFLAAPRVAFGRQRVAMRAAHHESATPVALLPRAPRTSAAPLDLRSLIARFWMAAALRADLHTEAPADAESRPAKAPISVDDVQSLVFESTTPAAQDAVDSALRSR